MRPVLRIVFFGVCVWAVPFALGMLLFPLQQTVPELFDTLMSVGVCTAAVLFGVLTVGKQAGVTSKNALAIGFIWAIICLAIDIPIFVVGMGMNLLTYMADIGVTYLILPIVLVGLAFVSRTNATST